MKGCVVGPACLLFGLVALGPGPQSKPTQSEFNWPPLSHSHRKEQPNSSLAFHAQPRRMDCFSLCEEERVDGGGSSSFLASCLWRAAPITNHQKRRKAAQISHLPPREQQLINSLDCSLGPPPLRKRSKTINSSHSKEKN